MFSNLQYLSTLKDFQDEINSLRSNPKSYLPALEDWLERIEGKPNPTLTNTDDAVKTEKESVKSAMKFLNSVKPTSVELKINKALCRAAQRLADDEAIHNTLGHLGTLIHKPK